MNIVLTNNPSDRGGRFAAARADCACDCQCACPVDGLPLPVLSLPAAYYLELTPACNNACPGCGNVYAHAGPNLPRPLDGAGWQNLIARLAAHAQQFKITGGEPTLHPDLEEIVRAVDRLAVPFTLFTNGRWDDAGALLELLQGLNVFDGFLISLHGPDAATHEAFSGVRGSFVQTVANVRRAAQAGFDVALSIVITQRNFNRIKETLDLALRLGANHLVCNRLIGAGRDGLTPDDAQLRAAMVAVESLRARGQPIRFGNCIPQCFEASSSTGCTAGSTFATIDPWGRMRPCNHAPLIAGDLLSHSVEAVWRGAAMARWRDLGPRACHACAAFAVCHGGCRAQAMLIGAAQDPLMRSPLSQTPVRPPFELPLFAGLRPIAAWDDRGRDEQGVLLSKGVALPVPPDYASLLSRLDGAWTLRRIEREYDHAALNWVGALYREGLVAWASNSCFS